MFLPVVLCGSVRASAAAWTPSTPGGLQRHYDASLPVYSDAGLTTPASVGGTVAGVPDHSGLGRKASGTSAVTLASVNGKRGLRFDLGQLAITAAAGFDRRDCSVMAVTRGCSFRNRGILGMGVLDLHLVHHYSPTVNASGNLGCYFGSAKVSTHPLPGGANPTLVGVRSTPTGVRFYLNDKTEDFSATTSKSVVPDQLAGYNGGQPYYGDILELFVHSPALDDGGVAAAAAYFAAKWGTGSPSKLLVGVGDSLTQGNTGVNSGWPDLGVAAGYFAGYHVANFGLGGRTAQDIASNVTAQFVPFAASPWSQVVFCVHAGTNDIGAGRTGAQVITDLTTITTALRAAGGYVVLCTCTPNQYDDATKLAYRNAINAAVRDGTIPSDAVSDLAADPRLSDFNDATYYGVDKLHYTPAGYVVVAEVNAAACP